MSSLILIEDSMGTAEDLLSTALWNLIALVEGGDYECAEELTRKETVRVLRSLADYVGRCVYPDPRGVL